MVGLATGVIAPISVEALIAYIKGENYSFTRALIVLGVISLAALVLLVIRTSARNLRTSLDMSLFLAGLATFGIGTADVVGSAGDGSSALAKGWGIVFLGILVLTLAAYSHVVSRNGSALLLATRQSPDPKEVEQFNVNSILTVHRFDDYQDADREVEEHCRQALDPQDLSNSSATTLTAAADFTSMPLPLRY